MMESNDSDDAASGCRSATEQPLGHEEPHSGEHDNNSDGMDDKKRQRSKKKKSNNSINNNDPSAKTSLKKEGLTSGESSSSKKKPQFTPKQRMDMYAFCVLELELQNQRILNRRQQMACKGAPAPAQTQMDSNQPMTYATMAPLDPNSGAAGTSPGQKRIIIHPPQQQTVVLVHGPPPQSPEQLQQLLQQPQMQQILQPPLYHTQAHFQLQFAQPLPPSTAPMLKGPNPVQASDNKSNKTRQTRRTKQTVNQAVQPSNQSQPPTSLMSPATNTTATSIQPCSSMPNQNAPNEQGTLEMDYNQQHVQTRFIINQGPDNQATELHEATDDQFQAPHLTFSHQTTDIQNQIRLATSQSNSVNAVQQIDTPYLPTEPSQQTSQIHRIPKKHECFSDYQNTQILSNHILKEVQKRFAYFYPNSPTPSRTTIKHVWDNCITLGTVQNKKKERKKTNQPMAEVIEYLLVHEPQLSLRQLAKKLNVSTGTVSKRCKELGLVPESVTLKHHQMALAKRQKQLKQIELITKAYEEENVDTNHRAMDNTLNINGDEKESLQLNSDMK